MAPGRVSWGQSRQRSGRVHVERRCRRGRVAINLLLATQTAADAIWFVYPRVGWGVGLAMHDVFGIRRLEAHITERQARIERQAAQG